MDGIASGFSVYFYYTGGFVYHFFVYLHHSLYFDLFTVSVTFLMCFVSYEMFLANILRRQRNFKAKKGVLLDTLI